ncbi:MAG: hypothetical protein AMXMBFR7_20920 [Planctomycetota bacterium]
MYILPKKNKAARPGSAAPASAAAGGRGASGLSLAGGSLLLLGALGYAFWPGGSAAPAPAAAPSPASASPAAPAAQATPAWNVPPRPAETGAPGTNAPHADAPDTKALPPELRMPVATPEEAIARLNKLTEILTVSNSLPERRAALDAVVALGDKAAPRLPALVESSGPEAVTWLADAAARLNATGAVRPILARYEREEPRIQLMLLDALGRLGGPDAAAFAREKLAQTDHTAFRTALWAVLAKSAEPVDLEPAFAALQSARGEDRQGAAAVLVALDTNDKLRIRIRELFDGIARDKRGEDLVPYLTALVRMPGQGDHMMLSEALISPVAEVRRMGVEGLSQNPLTIDRLSTVLQGESDPGVQIACLRVLVDRPQLLLVPKAVQLLDSRDYAVRGLAHRLLVETYGRNLGPYTGVWKSWLEQGTREKDHLRKTVFEAHQTLRIKERQAAQAEADSALSLVKR